MQGYLQAMQVSPMGLQILDDFIDIIDRCYVFCHVVERRCLLVPESSETCSRCGCIANVSVCTLSQVISWIMECYCRAPCRLVIIEG